MLSYSGKVVLAAACASAAPWVLCLFFARPAHPALLFAAAAVTIASFVTVHRLLRPLSMAAEALTAHIDAGKSRVRGDEMDVILRGISQLTDRMGSLQHRWAQRHSVTSLPTREYLLMEIGEDLAQSPSPALLGTIRFADYDRLSAFDAAKAELALNSLAQRLIGIIGKNRPLAHVDRDCFAIWFRGSDANSAAAELQAICYALSEEIVAGEMKVMPELEVGAATYPADGDEPSALVTRALVSLAKPGAAGKIGLFPGKSAEIAKERFSLEQDLRQAIGREQLELHFQPVVDLAKGALIGAEALIRWRHPEAGMISPARFIPILEDTDLTDKIGMWTLNAACREARGWERRGIKGLKVAVNLSARQLRDTKLKQMIQRTLERHQLQPQALELELTETAATEDAERTFALFGELRALGISLAIDDFGSGYSSLSYLKNLPFDKLKIDREFVVKVHERKDSQAICRSLIELTRGLGINILAEGVEERAEVDLLRRLGCHIFQGFYFSKPLAADEFIRRAVDPVWQGSLKMSSSADPVEINHRMTA
jgi:EAL domain-containing protein (putative c-di-GMP-specific phosphodiesterase class I)/GGDEF domain-containing protein